MDSCTNLYRYIRHWCMSKAIDGCAGESILMESSIKALIVKAIDEYIHDY